ncbi:MAG: hypothetical protein L7U87_07750 [Chlamydiales bacterium]|nr:hypothetical protein [Chlamydiales bacterium]
MSGDWVCVNRFPVQRSASNLSKLSTPYLVFHRARKLSASDVETMRLWANNRKGVSTTLTSIDERQKVERQIRIERGYVEIIDQGRQLFNNFPTTGILASLAKAVLG